MIKYVYFEYEPSARTIEGILDFLEEFDPRYNEEGVSELDEQFERLPDGHEAKRSYYLGFRQAQSEARPNIVISLLTTLQDFVDKEVAEFTSTNDFFFEELGTSKICLYVLISPRSDLGRLSQSLFSTNVYRVIFLGDKHNAKLPVPLVMLLDEFVNLGYFPTYENFLATCRGYRISVSTILQSLPQGFELYGDKKFKAIIGNHAIKICLGGVEETTAEYFSRQVNDTTIKVYTGGTSESKTSAKTTNRSGSKSESYGYQKRRLITEGEVINLQQEENGRKSIVLIDGKPYMLRKTPQFELFGNLLKKHEISQQDYISSQTEFAKEYIEELEVQHKQRKVQLASAPVFHEKKQENDLNKKEIKLPEQPIESEVTEEVEEKEQLMSDILSSFDESIEENTTNNDNSELPF